MKKIFDEDDDDFQNFDKAKIIVSVIPVVLIILILAVMLIVNNRKKTDRNTDDVQQSILDYADEGNQSEGLENNSVQTGSDAVENDKQEVQTGKASILCSVDGECKEYEIEIKEIRVNGKDVNKGMVIEVTDPELLEKTGGIVQGMSGSPIIQNGRIAGAVTHVFVNDPAKGYGIFIENMMDH